MNNGHSRGGFLCWCNVCTVARDLWGQRLASDGVRPAMWLSLIMTASCSPSLWQCPPPHRTAYFSRTLNPGVVFRVSSSRVLQSAPAARSMASRKSRVLDAMPDMRPTVLSMIRSRRRTCSRENQSLCHCHTQRGVVDPRRLRCDWAKGMWQARPVEGGVGCLVRWAGEGAEGRALGDRIAVLCFELARD